jgi:hypothetical protein
MIAPKNNGESVSHPNIGLLRLSLIAISVRAVTGFGAIGFRGLIGFIHNLFFLGRISFLYDVEKEIHNPDAHWYLLCPSSSTSRRVFPMGWSFSRERRLIKRAAEAFGNSMRRSLALL